ncbi:hypothetical protein CERSUDRAFT_85956 [Gelatoporia subvermispora B]|uniref:DUF6533 domain-containing protein n=1 Tax=Ceriporiopsis subvermispora (strain B) TaxID=914234 RepID=M2PF68_CERS8|nr:hypothetical protein CERSUDRAFT_85956 [Gelatoporia subvermispora B]
MLDQLSNGQRYMLNSLAHSNYPAASTVVFYDYIINISREIEYIWKRPFSVVTVLFGINRFALLVWAVANMPLYSYHKSALYWASVFTISVVQEAFTALRIYALVRKQLVLPISMLILSLTSILIPSYYMTSMTLSPAQYDIFGSITVAGAATSGLVDLFVVVLTWYRTHTLNRLGCASRNPLADVLLGSGALYFFAFLVCDVTTLWDMFGMTAYIENIYFSDATYIPHHVAFPTRSARGCIYHTRRRSRNGADLDRSGVQSRVSPHASEPTRFIRRADGCLAALWAR